MFTSGIWFDLICKTKKIYLFHVFKIFTDFCSVTSSCSTSWRHQSMISQCSFWKKIIFLQFNMTCANIYVLSVIKYILLQTTCFCDEILIHLWFILFIRFQIISSAAVTLYFNNFTVKSSKYHFTVDWNACNNAVFLLNSCRFAWRVLHYGTSNLATVTMSITHLGLSYIFI